MGRKLLLSLVYLSSGVGGHYREHSDILHPLSEEEPPCYNHSSSTLHLLPQFPRGGGAGQAVFIQLLKIQL